MVVKLFLLLWVGALILNMRSNYFGLKWNSNQFDGDQRGLEISRVNRINPCPLEPPRGSHTSSAGKKKAPDFRELRLLMDTGSTAQGTSAFPQSCYIDWSVVRALWHDALLCPEWLPSDRLHGPHSPIKQSICKSRRRFIELDGVVEKKVTKELDC